jgi:hypothetical protein
MALIKITETEVENKPRENTPLPEGAYEVYIDTVYEPETAGDLQKTSIMFRVRDDVEGDHPRRTIFTNITTADNMGWKLSNIARAVGVPAGTDFENLEQYAAAIAGKSLRVLVAHREYNGKIYTDAKGFYATRLAPYALETDLI